MSYAIIPLLIPAIAFVVASVRSEASPPARSAAPSALAQTSRPQAPPARSFGEPATGSRLLRRGQSPTRPPLLLLLAMAAAFAAAVFILIRLLGRTAPGQGVYRERNRLSRNEILGFIAVLLLLGLIAAAVVVWLRHSGHSARRLPLPIFPSGLRPGSQAFPLAPPRAPARLPAPRLDFSSPLLFLVLAQAALVSAFRLVMKSGRTMKVRAGVGALAGRPIEGLPEAAVLAGGGDIAVLYRRICRRLTVVVPYGEELTPREYVGRLLAAGIALPEIERLTTLFELERYRGARRAGRESPSKGEASRLAAAIERRLDAGEGARGGAVDG